MKFTSVNQRINELLSFPGDTEEVIELKRIFFIFTVSKPIQAKSNVNKVAPEVKKNNITKKPALRITKVANEDKKEEPIQKLTPDTIKQKN